MKKCPKCGLLVSDSQKDCFDCGYKFPTEPSAKPSTEPQKRSVKKKRKGAQKASFMERCRENYKKSQKHKTRNGVIGFAVIILLLFIIFSPNDKKDTHPRDSNPAKEETDVESIETAADEPSGSDEKNQNEPAELSDDDKIEIALASSKLILSENFPDHFNISRDGNTITVNVWQEGVAFGALYANAGDADTLKLWSTMKDNVQYASSQMYNALNGADGHVVVNVLNDQNMENTLLMYMDGKLVYDSVTQD